MMRLRWIKPLLLVVGVLAGLWLAATVWAAFPLGPLRLSATNDVCDFEPRAAVSADGQWLAATWIKGNMVNQGCVSRGQAVVRWANEGATQTNWSAPQTLALPGGACAIHADVTLLGTTAHIAVSYWSPCDDAAANSAIRYYSCNLTGGACTAIGDVFTQPGSSGKRISDARIVLDTQNRPHIVYAQGLHTLANGEIYYTRRLAGGTWTTPVMVSNGAPINGFYRPVVAAANGRIHIAWERHRNDGLRSRGDVQYRYCDEETGVCSNPSAPLTFSYPDAQLLETTYPLPTIAARGNDIFLVWNVCADVNVNFPCEKFYLLYARSNDNGLSWPTPREVGTDIPVSMINTSLETYTGTDGSGLVSEYASHVRPVVALDHNGLPRIAAQVQMPENGYVITTTYALSRTETSYNWGITTTWQVGAGADMRIAPAIVLPAPGVDMQGFHFFYMRAWRQQVGSQLYSRSQIYYDYYGGRRMGGEQVIADTYTSNHVLPAERAQLLRAQVRDTGGQGVGGARVMFGVRDGYGSFNSSGVTGPTIQVITEPDGWAEATLYTNLPGTVVVDAWLDFEANGVWDADEPATSFTHNWTANVTPTMQIGVDWALIGDLMTTTLSLHPYSNESYAGYPIEYAVILCSTNSGSGPDPVLAAHNVRMDTDTWSYTALVNLPLDTPEGEYYLESHEDESLWCDPQQAVAYSDAFTVSDEPPEGVAWITVADNRPLPGRAFQATLKYHQADTYTIWWCPVEGTPVSRKIKDNVSVPVTDQPTPVSLNAPTGVSGLYRLESHRGSGAYCGNLATRAATSSLLRPYDVIYLPLVLRNYRH